MGWPNEPGEMLPSTSQLADELGLNLNTINNAFTQLRNEGLVTMQRGRGTQVVDGIKTASAAKGTAFYAEAVGRRQFVKLFPKA